MEIYRDRLHEALSTLGGAIGLFLLFGSPFIILGTISAFGWARHGMFAPFILSNQAPNFMHPAATNLAVTSLCAAALVLLVVAITWRYFYYRKEIEFLRNKGITDFDEDGKRDNFADDFLDDL